MTDTMLLEKIIEDSGVKKKAIAERLDLSPQGLRNKLSGVYDFTIPEMMELCSILKLNAKQREQIFLKKNVPKRNK